jgi:hypothetical protein
MEQPNQPTPNPKINTDLDPATAREIESMKREKRQLGELGPVPDFGHATISKKEIEIMESLKRGSEQAKQMHEDMLRSAKEDEAAVKASFAGSMAMPAEGTASGGMSELRKSIDEERRHRQAEWDAEDKAIIELLQHSFTLARKLIEKSRPESAEQPTPHDVAVAIGSVLSVNALLCQAMLKMRRTR